MAIKHTISEQRIHAGERAVPCRAAGTEADAPVVLCLHGFPDIAASFDAQLPALAAAGYRAIAPTLRGYHPDWQSADNAYQTAALADDAVALLDALDIEQAVIFGHDWGAAIAGAVAAIAPERVRALITAAVPYGGSLGSSFVTDLDQQRRSWYMFFFQTPFAEAAALHADLAFIRRLWQDWSPTWAFTEADIRPVLDALAQPGVMAAAIQYYRCALNPEHQHERYATAQAKVGATLAMPCLHLHGNEDGCIDAGMTAGMDASFSGPLEIELLDGLGHFLHREDPAMINALVLDFLARHAPS
ncbi:MAG: alpha/beta hydrolase [Pseudomonadota bacterium]